MAPAAPAASAAALTAPAVGAGAGPARRLSIMAVVVGVLASLVVSPVGAKLEANLEGLADEAQAADAAWPSPSSWRSKGGRTASSDEYEGASSDEGWSSGDDGQPGGTKRPPKDGTTTAAAVGNGWTLPESEGPPELASASTMSPSSSMDSEDSGWSSWYGFQAPSFDLTGLTTGLLGSIEEDDEQESEDSSEIGAYDDHGYYDTSPAWSKRSGLADGLKAPLAPLRSLGRFVDAERLSQRARRQARRPRPQLEKQTSTAWPDEDEEDNFNWLRLQEKIYKEKKTQAEKVLARLQRMRQQKDMFDEFLKTADLEFKEDPFSKERADHDFKEGKLSKSVQKEDDRTRLRAKMVLEEDDKFVEKLMQENWGTCFCNYEENLLAEAHNTRLSCDEESLCTIKIRFSCNGEKIKATSEPFPMHHMWKKKFSVPTKTGSSYSIRSSSDSDATIAFLWYQDNMGFEVYKVDQPGLTFQDVRKIDRHCTFVSRGLKRPSSR